jgi:hypothetical protein
MSDRKNEVASGYGEGDIEAKSMTQAAEGEKKAKPNTSEAAKVPPPDVAVPVSGTTETDLARNLKEKAQRSRKP